MALLTLVEVIGEVCYLITKLLDATPKRKEFVKMGAHISLRKILKN